MKCFALVDKRDRIHSQKLDFQRTFQTELIDLTRI